VLPAVFLAGWMPAANVGLLPGWIGRRPSRCAQRSCRHSPRDAPADRYDSGSGATYVERDFAGTGVTNFDAAKGATIDSPLTEVPNQDAHGTLGVLTSMSGTIDCGNQVPGSPTLTFSGPTPKGALSGGLSPVNVECVTNTFGKSVSVLGILQVGTTPTDMIMSVSPGTFSVYPVGAGFYRNTSTAVATLTATGAHIDGDVLEQNVAKGATAHTIHVTGDVTCGTSVGKLTATS
jgi:hypothetical protein